MVARNGGEMTTTTMMSSLFALYSSIDPSFDDPEQRKLFGDNVEILVTSHMSMEDGPRQTHMVPVHEVTEHQDTRLGLAIVRVHQNLFGPVGSCRVGCIGCWGGSGGSTRTSMESSSGLGRSSSSRFRFALQPR